MLPRRALHLPLALLAAACTEGGSTRDPVEKPEPLAAFHLTVDARAFATLLLERQNFAADSCEVAQGCVGEEGERLVLRLVTGARNDGDADLVLGTPGEEEPFAPPRCGSDPVLPGFLRWRVLDPSGNALIREGLADVACLSDGTPFARGAAQSPRFSCSWQGLQAGWSALSIASDACGGADLTGIEPGQYLLELTLDPDGNVDRGDPEARTVRVYLTVPGGCGGDRCGDTCCPAGVPCVEGRCALPDLSVDEEALLQSIRLDEGNFGTADCAMDEGCVDAPGDRRLLRFTTSTPNLGGADLVIGDPLESPEATWSACHEHYHMADFASYRLVDGAGQVVARGHKQAFCLMDTQSVADYGPTSPRFDCSYQGISRGWSDSYGSGLDCQWIDVTDVPEGDYVLEVEVNGARRYEEADYENNLARVPVFLPADPNRCVPREEVCGDGRDQDCDGAADDGCTPLSANDACERAWALDGSGTWTGWIGGTTQVPTLPGSCGGAGGALHFSFTVLAEEIVYLSTYGSSIDTVLRIEGGACDAASEVACTDDGCGTLQSSFAGALPPGNYRAIVQAKEPGASGIVRLTVQRSGCGGAKSMPAPGMYEGNTSGGGADLMTSCGLGLGPDELWYFATCPGSTSASIDSCGSGYDTVLELRQGSCRGRARACNDDAPGACAERNASRVRAELAGEGLWFLLVDGYLGDNAGPYRLNATW